MLLVPPFVLLVIGLACAAVKVCGWAAETAEPAVGVATYLGYCAFSAFLICGYADLAFSP